MVKSIKCGVQQFQPPWSSVLNLYNIYIFCVCEFDKGKVCNVCATSIIRRNRKNNTYAVNIKQKMPHMTFNKSQQYLFQCLENLELDALYSSNVSNLCMQTHCKLIKHEWVLFKGWVNNVESVDKGHNRISFREGDAV